MTGNGKDGYGGVKPNCYYGDKCLLTLLFLPVAQRVVVVVVVVIVVVVIVLGGGTIVFCSLEWNGKGLTGGGGRCSCCCFVRERGVGDERMWLLWPSRFPTGSRSSSRTGTVVSAILVAGKWG
jgi:hypothetical protein